MITLAWRNLWRQRRRSLVTLSAIAVVVLLSLLYYSLGGASINSIYENLTETGGQIQVHTPGWRDERDFATLLIRDADALRVELEDAAAAVGEAEAIGVLEVPVLLAGEDRSRAVVTIGQSWPAGVRERFESQFLAAGSFVEADDLDGVMLGETLARALEVEIGDEVLAYAPGTEGYGAGAYRVVALLDLRDPAIEARAAYLSLAAAQELAAADAVTRFEIHFPGMVRRDQDVEAQAFARVLAAELPAYQVETWDELTPGLVQLLASLGPMMGFVSGIFFILAGLLVVNTIYLSLMERIHEFGVIISLGANARTVMGMITLESLLLCGVGALVGTGLGLAAVAWLSRGFSVPGLEEYYASFGLTGVFYASLEPQQVLYSVGFALVTGLLAALWPASVAARLEPVEAMRFAA